MMSGAALIGLGFAWMMTGVPGLSLSLHGPAAVAVLVAALAIGLVLARRRRTADEHRPTDRRWLVWCIGSEAAGIGASLAFATTVNRGALILPLVGMAVGLHFLPMARGFGRPMLVLTGILATLAAPALITVAGPGRLRMVGFGAGGAMWATMLADAPLSRPAWRPPSRQRRTAVPGSG